MNFPSSVSIPAEKLLLLARNAATALFYFRRHREYWKGRGEPLDGAPIPPLRFISRVTGTPDIAWFLVSGKRAARSMIGILRQNGIHVCSFGSILDFGCGCGRVSRYLLSLPLATIHGTDFDVRAVTWCQECLQPGVFQPCGASPPLQYRGEEFDFIYALSVFTHLSERLAIEWFHELARILRKNGYLFFTAHGEAFLDSLSREDRQKFLKGKIVVKNEDCSGTNHCKAYFSKRFVANTLSKDFFIIDFQPLAASGNPGQDVYLLRKK